MPISPILPYPKAQGQTIRAMDWNQAVNEIIRLDTAKVDRTGDRIAGPLSVDGFLGVGTPTPQYALDVRSGGGVRLSLEKNGGGQLILANNPNDNKIFLEAFSADGASSAAELLLTGRFGYSVPQITLTTRNTVVGTLEIGGAFIKRFSINQNGVAAHDQGWEEYLDNG